MYNQTKSSIIQSIDFWNGNKSEIRQEYESDILNLALQATSSDYGSFTVIENRIDYTGEEESVAFSIKNHDVLVTVAGNLKFKDESFIMVPKPLAKLLLSYRIPILKKELSEAFSKFTESEIKAKRIGIPKTWSDADIFRHNGFKVCEEGSFDDIFNRLDSNQFDYITFGANEIKSIFKHRTTKIKGLTIEKRMMFFYALPLVFYVNPRQKQLAERVQTGLNRIENNGTLDAIFNKFYGSLIKDLNLKNRNLIQLENPFIPKVFYNLKLKIDSKKHLCF